MDLLTFQDAIKESKSSTKRHLLIGNGFSIAWKPNVFQYSSLYDQADFDSLNPEIKGVFESLDTTDFEIVMRYLIVTFKVLKIYNKKDKALIKKLKDDAESLKSLLINTIASNHPESPGDILESEYENCITFLNNFNNVYSLNYDLLLYWVIMHYNEINVVKYDDGFRTPYTGKAGYVTWEIENTNKQNIHYLHGALHLFDAGAELQKYTWVNTGIKLIEQIRAALDNDFFPLFVSEGESSNKKKKIVHSNYLSRGLRSFASITGSLFIYGHSLAENDEHILRLISKGKVEKLFVGLYGNVKSKDNKVIIRRATELVNKRNNNKNLELHFYSSESANVWR